jgi:hypothetical protein
VGGYGLGLVVDRHFSGPFLTIDLYLIPVCVDVIHNFMHRLWITVYRGFRDKIRTFRGFLSIMSNYNH